MVDVLEMFDKLFRSKLDERGRIYVPKALRDRLLMREGDRVYIESENDHFIVYTAKAIKRALVRPKQL